MPVAVAVAIGSCRTNGEEEEEEESDELCNSWKHVPLLHYSRVCSLDYIYKIYNPREEVIVVVEEKKTMNKDCFEIKWRDHF